MPNKTSLSSILSHYKVQERIIAPSDLREALRTACNGSLALSIAKENSGFYFNGIIMVGERRKGSLFEINHPVYVGYGCDSDLKLNAERVDRNLVLIGDGKLRLTEEHKVESYEIKAYSIEDLRYLEKVKEKEKKLPDYRDPDCREFFTQVWSIR